MNASVPAVDSAPGQPTSTATHARPERYQLIESLRGIACLMVVVVHTHLEPASGPFTPLLDAIGRVAHHGALGVHMFFAISGWCIAERFAQARTRHETASHFLRERLLRIFPTYWGAIAAVIALRLLAACFNHTQFADNYPPDARSWLGTLLLIDPYLGTPAYLPVSWSLVFELGFYACAALALFSPKIDGRVIVGIGALLCVVPWIFTAHNAPWLVLEFWPNFFVGVAAWCAVRRNARLFGWGLLLMLATATIAFPPYDSSGLLAAIATALALMLLHPWDQQLSARGLVRTLYWCGGISYSLYLIHAPILSAWHNLARRFVPTTSATFIALLLAGILIAIAAGWALARYVEKPAQRWRKRRTVAAVAASAAAT